MYASRIYVTGLVPCWVNAVDFLLYELHVFRGAVSSYLSSLHTYRNSIFKCISYAQTINITPTWIHFWADLAEKPKSMCRAMITSSLWSTSINRFCKKGYVFPYIYMHWWPPNPSFTEINTLKNSLKFFRHIINYLQLKLVNSNTLNSNFRITGGFPSVPTFFLHKVTKFTSDHSRSDNLRSS